MLKLFALLAFFDAARGESVALCVAGELRTFFHEDVQHNFKAAVLHAIQPDLFFQVSIEDHSRSGLQFQRNITVAATRQKLLNLKPAHINIATDAELEMHPSWRGDFIPYAHLSFRWSLCLNDMEDEEQRGGFRYRWIMRSRPDIIWMCSLPQHFSWASVANIFFIWDMVVVMDRAHADVVLRQYPNSFGTVPCILGYSAHCQWSSALRSPNRNSTQVRWLFPWAQFVYFRRHCVMQDDTCAEYQPKPINDSELLVCNCEESNLRHRPAKVPLVEALNAVNNLTSEFRKSLEYISV